LLVIFGVVLSCVPAALAGPGKGKPKAASTPASPPAAAPAPAPDPDAMAASVNTAKLAGEAARDSAHTAAEASKQAAAGRKQSRSEMAAQRASLDKLSRAADAAYRAFASKGPVAPAQPAADQALAAAIRAYEDAKKAGATLMVAAAAGNLGEEQAMANMTTLSGQLDAVLTSIKQADATAKKLEQLAKKDATLAERAKLVRADVKAAQVAAAAAKQDIAAVARDLQLGPIAGFSARRQKSAAELAKVQGKLAVITSTLVDLNALQALGPAKGSCDLRRVDFRNAAYPTFKLKNGSGVVRSEGARNVTYLTTTFGDLDGDNSLEAFVAVEGTASAKTQGAIGHADAGTTFYVFGTDAKCKLKPIGSIAGGFGAQGRISGNAFAVGTGSNARSYRVVNGAIVEGK
jgi:hypothetical protein